MSNPYYKNTTFSVKQQKWTAYKKEPAGAPIDVIETFIDWDDPYKNIKFWTIIDFLRNFKLTK